MPVQTRIWFGLSLSVFTLTLIAIASARSADVAFEKSSWVDHSYEVVMLLDAAIAQYEAAEIAQKSYLLTGQTGYLESHRARLATIVVTLTHARNLTNDNPTQQLFLDQIEVLCREKLDRFERSIQYYQSGDPERAFQMVAADRGRQLMDSILAVFQQMKAEEMRLLAAHKDETIRAVNKIMYLGYMGGLLILVGIAFALFAFIKSNTRRYLLDHNNTEHQLRSELVILEQAFSEMKTLPEELCLCPSCKAIRNNQGTWEKLESLLSVHTEANIIHDLCSDCTDEKSSQ